MGLPYKTESRCLVIGLVLALLLTGFSLSAFSDESLYPDLHRRQAAHQITVEHLSGEHRPWLSRALNNVRTIAVDENHIQLSGYERLMNQLVLDSTKR